MNAAGKAGSTLVEVMFSCLILAIIAIAGAEYLAQATATLDVQRNRMSALATANRYMDEWRGTPWAVVTNRLPSPPTYVTNYVNRTGFCSWSSGSSSKLGGSVTNNGVVMTVTNTLSYFNAGASAPNGCANISVSVMDPKHTNCLVVLRTLVSPP